MTSAASCPERWVERTLLKHSKTNAGALEILESCNEKFGLFDVSEADERCPNPEDALSRLSKYWPRLLGKKLSQDSRVSRRLLLQAGS